MNFNGFIEERISPFDLQYGGLSVAGDKILFPDGCFKYLPEFEPQSSKYFQSNSCVSQSANNAIETAFEQLIESGKMLPKNMKWLEDNGYFKNGRINFNDRALAIASNTNPEIGNSLQNVYRAMGEGLASENIWPWEWDEADPKINNVKNYYNDFVLPEEVKNQMAEFKKRFKVLAEWVYQDKWLEAEKRGVLQVVVKAWSLRLGKYYNPTPGFYNHGVMNITVKDLQIFDTFQPSIKEIEKITDINPWALKFNIKEIMPIINKPDLKQNSLVFCAGGNGEIGLFLDGYIIIDDLAKVMATWAFRSEEKKGEGDEVYFMGRKRTIEKDQWDLFDKRNLKKELLSVGLIN